MKPLIIEMDRCYVIIDFSYDSHAIIWHKRNIIIKVVQNKFEQEKVSFSFNGLGRGDGHLTTNKCIFKQKKLEL